MIINIVYPKKIARKRGGGYMSEYDDGKQTTGDEDNALFLASFVPKIKFWQRTSLSALLSQCSHKMPSAYPHLPYILI